MRRCPLDYLPRREMTYFATGLYDDRFSVGPYDADIRHFGSKIEIYLLCPLIRVNFCSFRTVRVAVRRMRRDEVVRCKQGTA